MAHKKNTTNLKDMILQCVIRLAPTAELARKRAYNVMDAYGKRFPKAIQCLEDGLEDYTLLDARKIES